MPNDAAWNEAPIDDQRIDSYVVHVLERAMSYEEVTEILVRVNSLEPYTDERWQDVTAAMLEAVRRLYRNAS